jgi:hypothetical protein
MWELAAVIEAVAAAVLLLKCHIDQQLLAFHIHHIAEGTLAAPGKVQTYEQEETGAQSEQLSTGVRYSVIEK